MSAYYNEIDPYAAHWLRNLIDAAHIAPGDVDERSIAEVQPDDLRGYTQCHFFAGLGGWSLALRLAGWDDSRPVWTGSCPCQPFSAAGRQKGTADERHLWPEFYRLIRECRPAITFGEQVASRLGREWLAGVFADLEDVEYAVAGADLCAASAGAPHIRQRLWWVADADPDRQQEQRRSGLLDGERQACGHNADGRGAVRGVGDADGVRLSRQCGRRQGGAAEPGGDSRMADSETGRRGEVDPVTGRCAQGSAAEGSQRPEHCGGAWDTYVWLPCADGKARRIEPSIVPLVDGLSEALDGLGPISRVGALKGAGNAIVPQVAATFVRAAM